LHLGRSPKRSSVGTSAVSTSTFLFRRLARGHMSSLRSSCTRFLRSSGPKAARYTDSMFLRRPLLSLAVLAAIAGAACGDPPDREMQQAQGAIDAARAVGADQYAREEFSAAEDALKRAHDAVNERDYRQALNAALDARERAQTAAKDSVDGKARAR